MAWVQIVLPVEGVLLLGTLCFVYAFGMAYLGLVFVCTGSFVLSFFAPQSVWLAKAARVLKGVFFVLYLLSFFVALNTVLVLRVGSKICEECLVISSYALWGFYLYTALYCLLAAVKTYSFFKIKKNSGDNEECSSSISYKQITSEIV
ncbi:hypothetical protein NECID01_0263 [Nematocida sp. AWRm77]|nr:hypothetical protein NECID01_0263 [Nematocida sp. AWRm77]